MKRNYRQPIAGEPHVGTVVSDARIAVAMSGGVDSSVAAAFLKDDGYDVIGITALMTAGRPREDVQTARKVADQIGICHYAIDVQAEFEEQIIEYFVSEYVSGRTPSPCALCNSRIKFGLLMQKAFDLGATRMASGHYARVTTDESGVCHLLRGIDPGKDQSYFLFGLSQEQLRRLIFPLGSRTKREVTQCALDRKLASRKSRESQELCFISDDDHGSWIEARAKMKGLWRNMEEVVGDIVDMEGKKLGEHRGTYHYTIGQRRGLGVAVGQPAYVVKLDPARKVVMVGDRADASGKRMTVAGINWVVGESPPESFGCLTQIRHNHAGASGWVNLVDKDSVRVEFDEPQFAITPGQIAVFYCGEEMIGGGFIQDNEQL